MGRRSGQRRRISVSHFQGEGRTAERGNPGRKSGKPLYDFVNYLAHAQQGVILNALGGAYKQHLRKQPLRHVLEDAAAMMRRHHADDNFRSRECVLKIIRYRNRFRNAAIGQEESIDAGFLNARADFGFARPEPHLVLSAAAGDDGQRCPPRTRANDGDFAQACFSMVWSFFAPKRFSVPASRRRMFWLCFKTTSTATADSKASVTASVRFKK